MPRPSYALAMEPAGDELQDRVRVIEVGDSLVIAVADGAGGISGSSQAAEAVVQGIGALVESGVSLHGEATWTHFLAETDLAIYRAGGWGQTTAVALVVSNAGIFGASVGDSEGWLATIDDFRSLTAGQVRKPFLGSGAARPVSFRRPRPGGALVVGTDGLFKYAPAWRICQVTAGNPPEIAARGLLDLIRLPNGKLQDDIGFVVCSLSIQEGLFEIAG
jgi:hypothetical protein